MMSFSSHFNPPQSSRNEDIHQKKYGKKRKIAPHKTYIFTRAKDNFAVKQVSPRKVYVGETTLKRILSRIFPT